MLAKKCDGGGEVKLKWKWQMTDGMKSESTADKKIQLRRDEKKKKWKRSERVCGREEEGECTATMLQCGVCLLAAGFEEEAAGIFDCDCREMLVFMQSAEKLVKLVHFMHQLLA